MKKMTFFRYLCYSLEIIILFVLGTTPDFLSQISGSKACLLLPLALAIAVFEPELPAMFFGLSCGVLTDIGFSNSIGTFAIGLTIVCFIIGFCANNFVTATFLNVMLTSAVVITALLSIHFLFSYVIKGYDYAGIYYVNHYISRIVQSVLCTIPLYFMNRFVHSTLNEDI